jgi:starvation-inducible DNA-binding protein
VNAAPEHRQAGALDGVLADLVDLGLLAKQGHWNVVGPGFRALHDLLDELAVFARDSADLVAERAVTLGHPPDGRATTITERSSLPTVEPGTLRDADAVTAFIAILDVVVARIHGVVEAFETDYVSVDLFTRTLAGVEKYAWMLRAQRSW